MCRNCAYKKRKTKIEWPEKDVILSELNTKSREQLARELGVSGNSIKKYLSKK